MVNIPAWKNFNSMVFPKMPFRMLWNHRISWALAQNPVVSGRVMKAKSRRPEQDVLLRRRLTDMIDMRYGGQKELLELEVSGNFDVRYKTTFGFLR